MTLPPPATNLLIGGTSQIAARVMTSLRARGEDVMVLTGRPWTPPEGVEQALIELSTYDGSHTHHWKRTYDRIICVAPLFLGVRALEHLPDHKPARAVFLSSNNTALLAKSRDYERLRTAQTQILSILPQAIILQPTTITGRSADPVLGYFTRKAIAGERLFIPGLGTRQHPVDYRDVADALLHAVDNPIMPGEYSLSGPDALSYAQIIRTLETALWTRIKAHNIPPILARWAGATGLTRHSAALRRAGYHRDPVSDPLPGFTPHFRILDMIHALTQEGGVPS